ncbi:uncharacterized protein LOC105637108 [Jatropha curcas]|uniref:uncharacterized protein LOC105637108 n=1 Tax=Jatropha curcas TaxID=180498 RepID=UPI001894D14F|nr:uncharacterized protein LOC105637108 [Jatropha curcas]
MRYYLIGQDLRDIIGGDNTTPPVGDAKTLKEWETKCGKVMYMLMVTIEDEQMQQIKSAKTPNEAWNILKSAFAKKNEAKLQRLKNELFSISQQNLTVSLYFSKVKSLCEEISKLDPDNEINKRRMTRIIIYDLRPEFKGLVIATRGWATQPTLDELENILSNEETLD